MVILKGHFLERKTPIMGCHFFDVHVNSSYNVIPTYNLFAFGVLWSGQNQDWKKIFVICLQH